MIRAWSARSVSGLGVEVSGLRIRSRKVRVAKPRLGSVQVSIRSQIGVAAHAFWWTEWDK